MIDKSKYAVPETAMIFAAGLGTRMLPLTKTAPKPMVEICGKPLIDYRLDKLAEAGVKRVVVNTHHLAAIVENHLRQRTDMEIIISREETLLDTGGGLMKALPHLGERPFYVINSDVIWLDKGTPALLRLAEAWRGETMNALLLLHPVNRAIGYHGNGDFSLERNGQLRKTAQKTQPYVYTGVQILHPRILAERQLEPFSLSAVFREAAQPDGLLSGLYGLEHDGEWLHVDSVPGIALAERRLKESTGFYEKINKS